MKNKFKFPILFFLLSSSNFIDAQDADLNIQSIPISKNVSAILRTICFEGDKYILASNAYGSDIGYLNSSECDNNGVMDYKFVFSKSIEPATSGVIREIIIDQLKIIVYSGKKAAPTIHVSKIET